MGTGTPLLHDALESADKAKDLVGGGVLAGVAVFSTGIWIALLILYIRRENRHTRALEATAKANEEATTAREERHTEKVESLAREVFTHAANLQSLFQVLDQLTEALRFTIQRELEKRTPHRRGDTGRYRVLGPEEPTKSERKGEGGE